MFKKTVALLCSLFCCFANAAENTLTFNNAWIREAPPMMTVLAGYVDINNNSSSDISVTTISSPAFDRIEMHAVITEDGLTKMVQQQHINVKAGGAFSFKPGGFHLMLFDPVKALKAGDKVLLSVTNENTTQQVEAIVKKQTGQADHHHHHH
jgi:periplasmic copper chaperone A